MDEKESPQHPQQSQSHKHNRLILLLMVKNESRIIQRCLEGALPYVDAVALLDTGSTDDTVAKATQILQATQTLHRIEQHPFENFGQSRTRSFEVAQRLCEELQWSPETTYALAVDADMIIRPQPAFFDFPLTLNGYQMIQENGHMKYYNTRLMRCGHPWKCIGATHEYWSGDPTGKIPYELFYIDDKNDGGCKADKFERDVRLLTEDLERDPTNGRTHYYLGQSLKDLGRFDEAIQMFEKRIALGGWVEECWYARYQIGRCYDHKGDEHQMERWMNEAFKFHPTRSEPLYHLTRVFRERSQHYKAYHYYLKGRHIPYPKDDVLFIEKSVYEGLFEYEATILNCYVHSSPHSKRTSMIDLMRYLNRYDHYRQNTFDNAVYYAAPLLGPVYDGEYTPLILPPHQVDAPNEYQASSCSFVSVPSSTSQGYLLNARLVNYSIDARGAYHMRSPDGHVKTKNAVVPLNPAYQPIALPRVLEETYERHPSNIEGLEDMRLFYHDGELRFIASSKDATPTGKIVIACGRYDPEKATAYDVQVLEPPQPSACEKNWLYVENAYLTHSQSHNRMNFIYGWHPLQIGAIVPEEADTHGGTLQIHTIHQTPRSWEHFRGSAPPVEYEGKLYALVHHVRYTTPRQYLHAIVEFSTDMVPRRYTPLFCFRKTSIEYAIGFHLKEGTATFAISEYDASPGIVRVPWKRFEWLEV